MKHEHETLGAFARLMRRARCTDEAESRALLVFLVDLLPKSDATGGESDDTMGGGTLGQLRASLQQWRQEPWLPPAWSAGWQLPSAMVVRLRAALERSALAAARKTEQQEALEKRLRRSSTGGGDAEPSAGGGQRGGFGAALAMPDAVVDVEGPSQGALFGLRTLFTDAAGAEEARGAARGDADESETPISTCHLFAAQTHQIPAAASLQPASVRAAAGCSVGSTTPDSSGVCARVSRHR